MSDCEDAIAVDVSQQRFAIADGATEAFDSRRWARLLSRAWISRPATDLDDFQFIDCVRPLGARLERKWAGRVLPWYLAEKADSGSFAAFLGLRISDDSTWSAVALGDCCLFVERDNALHYAFPLTSADSFSSRPILVASKPNIDTTRAALRIEKGVCIPGDVFLMMSDAIACWYLANAISDPARHDQFHRALGEPDSFATFITNERDSRRLRNDDVAVLKLAVSPT